MVWHGEYIDRVLVDAKLVQRRCADQIKQPHTKQKQNVLKPLILVFLPAEEQ